MPKLVLIRRLNYGKVLLTDRPGGQVGYLLRHGERHFTPWLRFIERAAARALEDARPVRLTDITRGASAGWPAPEWREIAPGECVHGCLTSREAFAIYDAVVALVGAGSVSPSGPSAPAGNGGGSSRSGGADRLRSR